MWRGFPSLLVKWCFMSSKSVMYLNPWQSCVQVCESAGTGVTTEMRSAQNTKRAFALLVQHSCASNEP